MRIYIVTIMRVRTIFAIATVACVGYASKLQPQVLPLFVRNPYLSAWLGHAKDNPWDHWPIFWTGQEVNCFVHLKMEHSD